MGRQIVFNQFSRIRGILEKAVDPAIPLIQPIFMIMSVIVLWRNVLKVKHFQWSTYWYRTKSIHQPRQVHRRKTRCKLPLPARLSWSESPQPDRPPGPRRPAAAPRPEKQHNSTKSMWINMCVLNWILNLLISVRCHEYSWSGCILIWEVIISFGAAAVTAGVSVREENPFSWILTNLFPGIRAIFLVIPRQSSSPALVILDCPKQSLFRFTS